MLEYDNLFTSQNSDTPKKRDTADINPVLKGGVLGTDAIKELIEQYGLVEPKPERIDEVSFDIHLGNKFTKIISTAIKIGEPVRNEQLITFEVPYGKSIILHAGERLLGSTQEIITMPTEYFGMIQTKGSVSRAGLRIEDDFQIGPGFSGQITLQLRNMYSNSTTIEIPIGAAIGSLFVFSVIGNAQPYSGKFQGARGPTV